MKFIENRGTDTFYHRTIKGLCYVEVPFPLSLVFYSYGLAVLSIGFKNSLFLYIKRILSFS